MSRKKILLFGLLAFVLSTPNLASAQARRTPAAKANKKAPRIGRPGTRKTAPANAEENKGDPDPPGAAGALPTTMDKIAQATDIPFKPKPPGYRVKFNLQDADLAELVNHISGMTGRRFIYGAKVRQIKATVVSPQPVTLEEAYEAFLSILQVNGMTVVPHGRFLKIVDSAGVNTQSTPVYSRGAPVPATDRFVTRLYRLKYVSADEVAALLTKFKSKEGDISVHSAGQLLIITDTGSQVRRMIRIIEEVDVGGSGQHMWIEPVNYGTAEDLASRINELFELDGKGGGAAGGLGLQKVIADDQTNALIVVGTEDSYLKLLEVVKRLDSRPGEAGRVHVLPLQHAVAEELAQTLSAMLSGQPAARSSKKSKARAAPAAAAAGDGGGQFEGEVKVTADTPTNSLVITSSSRDYAQLRLVIDELDRPRRQVFIEAVIMDIGVQDGVDLGFSFHGGTQQDLGGDGPSLLMGGFQAGQSTAFPADPNLLQGFAAGVRGPDLPGTTNLLGTGFSIPAFGVVMNAIARSGRGKLLATPHVIATDNVAAEIQVGENVPLQSNVGAGIASLAAAGGAGQQASGLASLLGSSLGGAAPRTTVGNRIKITPHVNESSQVRLELELESSARGPAEGALGVHPVTTRTTTTTLVVQDQQTVVIGGLMRDEYTTSRDKVPVLGDLPVLGFLFRSSKVEKRKSNLLLVLTPHVVREQGDLRRIFERKMQERQEFLDRYFVFQSEDWTPPTDYARANGLVVYFRLALLYIV